jgi:hypothetical protein
MKMSLSDSVNEVVGRIMAPSMPAEKKDWVKTVYDELIIRFRENGKDTFGTAEIKMVLDHYKAPAGTIVSLKALELGGYAHYDSTIDKKDVYRLIVPGSDIRTIPVHVPAESEIDDAPPPYASQPNAPQEVSCVEVEALAVGRRVLQRRDRLLQERKDLNAGVDKIKSQRAEVDRQEAMLLGQIASKDCEIEEINKLVRD